MSGRIQKIKTHGGRTIYHEMTVAEWRQHVREEALKLAVAVIGIGTLIIVWYLKGV